MNMYPNIIEEQALWKAGFKTIAGVDEVGRGPLAGPAVVASVILPKKFQNNGIQDSKKISAIKREELFEFITENSIAYSIEIVSPKLIDKENIYQAVRIGMQHCVKKLEKTPDFVLLDAMNINLPEIPQKSIIKGDMKVLSIAAASILAKVYRDRLMVQYAKKYPQYGFEFHMGYPTKDHLEALKMYGPCNIHRFSYAPVKAVSFMKKKEKKLVPTLF